MTERNIQDARERIREAAHTALRAKRRRRTATRVASAATVVVLLGAIAWWSVQGPSESIQTDRVVASGDSAAKSGISLQIVSLTPEPVEQISDEDLARALRDAGSPYGLVISERGVRAVPNSQGL